MKLGGNFILSGKICECPVYGIFTKTERNEIEFIQGEVDPGSPNYNVSTKKTSRSGTYGTINITSPEQYSGTWEAGNDNNGFWKFDEPSNNLSGGEFRFTNGFNGVFKNDLNTVSGVFKTYDYQNLGTRIIPYPLNDDWVVSWYSDTPVMDVNTDSYIGLPAVPKDKISWLTLGFKVQGISNLLSSDYSVTGNPFVSLNQIETNNVIDYPFIRFPEATKFAENLKGIISSIYISDIIDGIRDMSYNVTGNSFAPDTNNKKRQEVISGWNVINDNLLDIKNALPTIDISAAPTVEKNFALSGALFGSLLSTNIFVSEYAGKAAKYYQTLTEQLNVFQKYLPGSIAAYPSANIPETINLLWNNVYTAYNNAQHKINFTTIKYKHGTIPQNVISDVEKLTGETVSSLLPCYISNGNYSHNINMEGLVVTAGVYDYVYIKNNNEEPVERLTNILVSSDIMNSSFITSLNNIQYKSILQPDYERSWKEKIIKGYVVNLIPEIPSGAVKPNTKIKIGFVLNENLEKVWEIEKSSIEVVSGDLLDPEILVSSELGEIYVDAPRYENFDKLYLSGIELVDISSAYQYYTSGIVMSSWMNTTNETEMLHIEGIQTWDTDGSFEIKWENTDMGLLKEAVVKDIILSGKSIQTPIVTGVMDDLNTYYAHQLVYNHIPTKKLHTPYK